MAYVNLSIVVLISCNQIKEKQVPDQVIILKSQLSFFSQENH